MLVSAKIFHNLASALIQLNVDAPLALQKAGVSFCDIQDAEKRLPAALLTKFWRAAASASGDPHLGLRVGALARLDSFGVLGLVARSSATLGDALLKTTRYLALWNESLRFSVLVEDERVQLWFRAQGSESRAPTEGDAQIAILLALSKELAGAPIEPLEVHLAHAAPIDDSVYRATFGVVPTFNAFEYSIIFPSELLLLPIHTHDSVLVESLSLRAAEFVNALPKGGSFSQKVKAIISSELRGGNPMLENVAGQIGIHMKTLTRRLRQEGTSHSEILDLTRRELAQHYLCVPRMNVNEVAFLLGFSDASAFIKAFRRWFGIPPLAYRTAARRSPGIAS